MEVICIDGGDSYGTGHGLLTQGKTYTVLGQKGGYYTIRCDDGRIYTKMKTRFKQVKRQFRGYDCRNVEVLIGNTCISGYSSDEPITQERTQESHSNYDDSSSYDSGSCASSSSCDSSSSYD